MNPFARGSPRAHDRSRRVHRVVALLAALVLGLAVMSSSSLALFTSSDAVAGNVITVDDCFQAQVGSVQSGEVTNTTNGVQSVSITAVDVNRSFLLFSIRSDLDRPVGSTVRGRLASSTTVEFARVTDEGTPASIVVAWSVVEYSCGVTVQHGSLTSATVVDDVTITAVGLDRTFVTASKTAEAAAMTFSANDAFSAYLTAPTNLRFGHGAAAVGHEIWWQVIEFENAADALVQRGSVSMTGAAVSVSDTLTTAVDPNRAFVLASYETNGDGADVGARLIRAELVDSTTVMFDRDAVGDADDITDIRYEVIELGDGSVVQSGVTSMPSGTSSVDVDISPVDVATSTVISTVSGFAGQSTGSTGYVADDVVGVASAEASLTDATTVNLLRSNTAASAMIGWSVVTWGGPPWWDTSYTFRRQVAATAGSGGTPGVIDLRISSDSNDAEEASDGTVDRDSSDLELIQEGSKQLVGMRFPAIGIPQGAQITSAWIQFTVDETSSGALTVTIQAEDTDSAAGITTTSFDLSDRSRTSASVTWSPPDWPTADVAGADQRTSDFTSVVQEVVDRAGWTSSSALLVLISGTDSTRRIAEAHDGVSASAPLIHVEYTVGGAADSGYVVPVTLDHAALVGSDVADISGDDVRLAHWDGTTWTELDRIVDSDSSWNLTNSGLWFPLAAAIPAETARSSYWLYHRNPASGSPPTAVAEPVDPAPTVASSDVQTRDAGCGGPLGVASVQNGTLTVTANGTQGVTISAVDTTKAFLLFSLRSNSNRPVASTVNGRVATSTSIEFSKVTDETAPVDISWSVVEYSCGVSVQRGSVGPDATSKDITLTSIDRSRSFVTASKTVDAADGAFGDNDPFTIHLTSSTNLRVEQNVTGSSHAIWWQVVEFTNSDAAFVQRGSASLTGGSLSTSATLGEAVDTARSFVLASWRSAGNGSDVGARLLLVELTDADTVTFSRDAAGDADDITDIRYEVVELHEGSRVQHGTTVLSATTATVNVAIDSVNTASSSAFATVQGFGSQSVGSTDYVADDVVGEATATLRITSATNLEVRRASTVGAAEIGWTVVDWSASTGPGPWWDTSFTQRRLLEITTGADAAPSGTVVSLTIDHAAMVAKGLSRADGDDVRIVYWNGSTWAEVDRVLAGSSSWNSATTQLWFETGAALGASSVDTDHWIHLANASAGAPPTAVTEPAGSDVVVTVAIASVADRQ